MPTFERFEPNSHQFPRSTAHSNNKQFIQRFYRNYAPKTYVNNSNKDHHHHQQQQQYLPGSGFHPPDTACSHGDHCFTTAAINSTGDSFPCRWACNPKVDIVNTCDQISWNVAPAIQPSACEMFPFVTSSVQGCPSVHNVDAPPPPEMTCINLGQTIPDHSNLVQVNPCHSNLSQVSRGNPGFAVPRTASSYSGENPRRAPQTGSQFHHLKSTPKFMSTISDNFRHQPSAKTTDAQDFYSQKFSKNKPMPGGLTVHWSGSQKDRLSIHNHDELFNKRHSTRKLVMSCLAPRMTWNKQTSNDDSLVRPRKDVRLKKRKKSSRGTTAETVKSTERENGQNGQVKMELTQRDFNPLNDEHATKLENAFQFLRLQVHEQVTPRLGSGKPKREESASSLSHFLQNNNDSATATKRIISQTNFNYNSGNSEPEVQQSQQSNNNSIPNGSIVTMAREMLKKNCFQSTGGKIKNNCEVYTLVDPNLGLDEDDEERNIRRKISDRWMKLTQSGDHGQCVEPVTKASKHSRSSLNTLQSQNNQDSSDAGQLITIPDAGVFSTSKKSRMYISNNVHLRRVYQPSGVINYLVQKFKHRQPKLSEGGQGYDQTVRNVVKNLHDSWLEQNQCDVAIVTDDGEIMAHQAVLSSFSPSLAALFKSSKPHTEHDNNPDIPHPILMINMSEFSRDIIADTLHFLYTTDIKLDISNVSQFVLVARRLELPVLSKICDDYLLNSGNLDNLLLHYLIANNCELSNIASSLETRIAQNFEVLWTKKHIVKLSRTLLLGILNHPELSISEINKFHAVAKWLEYNKTERIKYVCDLMKMVDFSKIEINSLLTTVKNLDWMFTNEAMRTKMLNAYKSSVGLGLQNSIQDEQRDSIRSPPSPLGFSRQSSETKIRRCDRDKGQSELKTAPAHLEELFQSSACSPFAQLSGSKIESYHQSKNNLKPQYLEAPCEGDFKTRLPSPGKGTREAQRNPPSKSPAKQKDTSVQVHCIQTSSPLEVNDPPSRERALAAMNSAPVRNIQDHRRRSNDSYHEESQRQDSKHKHHTQGTSPLRASPQSSPNHHPHHQQQQQQQHSHLPPSHPPPHHHHHHHHRKQTHHMVNSATGTSTPPYDYHNSLLDEPKRTNNNVVDDDDDDDYINGLKSQGVVSLFLPNYRPPPFKQYQLTNSSSVKYVEL